MPTYPAAVVEIFEEAVSSLHFNYLQLEDLCLKLRDVALSPTLKIKLLTCKLGPHGYALSTMLLDHLSLFINPGASARQAHLHQYHHTARIENTQLTDLATQVALTFPSMNTILQTNTHRPCQLTNEVEQRILGDVAAKTIDQVAVLDKLYTIRGRLILALSLYGRDANSSTVNRTAAMASCNLLLQDLGHDLPTLATYAAAAKKVELLLTALYCRETAVMAAQTFLTDKLLPTESHLLTTTFHKLMLQQNPDFQADGKIMAELQLGMGKIAAAKSWHDKCKEVRGLFKRMVPDEAIALNRGAVFPDAEKAEKAETASKATRSMIRMG